MAKSTVELVATYKDDSRRYESKIIQINSKQYLVTKTGVDAPLYYSGTGFKTKVNPDAKSNAGVISKLNKIFFNLP